MNRDLDLKVFQSMPDSFDIVKVQTLNTVGGVIPAARVIKITGKASPSGFGDLPANTVLVTDKEYTLKAGDAVTVLGVVGSYAGIQVVQDVEFPNDSTSVVLAGKGVNLSLLGELVSGTLIYGAFSKVSLASSEDGVVLAYK